MIYEKLKTILAVIAFVFLIAILLTGSVLVLSFFVDMIAQKWFGVSLFKG